MAMRAAGRQVLRGPEYSGDNRDKKRSRTRTDLTELGHAQDKSMEVLVTYGKDDVFVLKQAHQRNCPIVSRDNCEERALKRSKLYTHRAGGWWICSYSLKKKQDLQRQL